MTLTLRPIHHDDWQRIHEWSSRPEACRYQSWGPDTPEETEQFVSAAVADWGKDPIRHYTWAAVDGAVVGLGEVHIRGHRHGAIGYAVHTEHWGQGIGQGIARLVIAAGFNDLKLHRITGTCDPRNIASGRILAKAGMTYEGRMREVELIRDGWRDSDMYSILESEWDG